MLKLVDLNKQYSLSNLIIKKNISKVLANQNFIMGKEVNILEKKLKSITKSKYCLTVSSGTDALLISLMAINLKPGDEVIVPSFTYVSPVEAIVRLGALPVFVDICNENGNIDTSLIEKEITKKTKAIIFVNLFGSICNITKLKKIKNKNKKIFFIEDAAQSFGAKFKNYNSCNTLDISCTSFFPTKNLGCYGDGGAIFTNLKHIYNSSKMIREHGQKIKYHHDIVGIGGRLDTIQASILLAKLKSFKSEIILRKSNFKYYNQLIDKQNLSLKINFKIGKIKFPAEGSPNYASYNIFVRPEVRKKLITFLKKNKIASTIYYPKIIPDHKPYKKYLKTKQKLRNSEFVSKRILSLPFGPYIKQKEISYVVNILGKFFRKISH